MNTNPTPQPVPARTQTEKPHYFWKQCYEIGDDVHWALCDSESQKRGMVSSVYMVLHANYKTAIDGKTVGEQFMPAKIVELLNNESTHAAHLERIRELEEGLRITLRYMAEAGVSAIFNEKNQRVTLAELNATLKARP